MALITQSVKKAIALDQKGLRAAKESCQQTIGQERIGNVTTKEKK